MPENEATEIVDEIFLEADTDSSGFLEFSEFLKSSMAKTNLLSKKHLEAAFRMIDSDQNGKICRSELNKMMELTALAGDKKWMKLLSFADKNNDGAIDVKEFCDLLLQFQ